MVASRPFRPAGQPGSVVLAALAWLWDQAAARPAAGGEHPLTQKRLAAESGVPESTLSSWSRGGSLPQDPDQLAAAGRVLAGWAGQRSPGPREWAQMLETDRAARGTPASPGGPGQPIAGLDPFALEVHRPVTPDSGGAGLPALPPYVRRAHDESLAAVVTQAAAGRSAMAVVVGGSSTGKTRACWEALSLLPAGWRVWHPYDPTRPEAALGSLARVSPRTVIWLNETQHYLDAPGDTGERVAAALTALLADPARAPALILGTLWPEHWDTLTRDRGTRPQASAVLDGTSIAVPAAFTATALENLKLAAARDPRLAAAAGAADGQVTQYLAGAPVLLDRYRNAPPEARAVIEAAMDARRLGHSLALPHAFLEAAAPAYLTGAEWDALGDDWLEQALAWTAAPCKGAAGPVIRIRPRPRPGEAPPGPGASGGPAYKLADYLEQHARRHRGAHIPPDGFWAAAARHATPGTQAGLARAASDRGLYRHAAQLRKNATRHGDARAGARLIFDLRKLDPSDRRPASFAAAHVVLEDPGEVAVLLAALRRAGTGQQVAELAARAAAEIPLDGPRGAAMLLDSLRKAGAAGQFTELATRAAAEVPVDDVYSTAALLDRLWEAEGGDQAAGLAARAAAGVPLDHPGDVAVLLDSLLRAGAGQQVTELAARAAAEVPVDDVYGTAALLGRMREAGARAQAATLAARPAAGASVDDPAAAALLLDGMRAAGSPQQVADLTARAAAGASLGNPDGVVKLWDSLLRAGAGQQANELVARAAADMALHHISRMGKQLDRLRNAGAAQQAAQHATKGAARPAWLFFLHPDSSRPQYRFGRQPDGRPAPPWGWDDLN